MSSIIATIALGSMSAALANSCFHFTMPCLSMRNMARLAVPRVASYTPYNLDIAPLGSKSARSGYGIEPTEAANAVWVGRASVLIPSTWVSLSSKLELCIRNEETWCVQPPVNENM